MTSEATPITDAVVGAFVGVSILLLSIRFLAKREKTEFNLLRILGALFVGCILVFGPMFLGVAFMNEWRRAPLVGLMIGFLFMYGGLYIVVRNHKNQKPRNENGA